MGEDRKSANATELPRGAYSRIARRLRPKVTPQHVREVALGNRRSPRVERAIQTYLAGLQRAAEPKHDTAAA
jgi:hypothetical protein